MRVAVVGCGLIGAAVARELQRRGARTVVYEARRPGAGTSGTTFAWVNAHDKQPRAYHDLNVAGMEAHLELQAQASSKDRWLFPTGNLVWADDPAGVDRLSRRADRLVSWGYPVQVLTPDEALELEPVLRIGDRVDRVLLFPTEGHALPAVLLDRLLGEALQLGAELRCPARVERVTPTPNGITLRLAGGSTDTVDVAVCCAGRLSTGVLASAGFPLPLVDHETPGSPALGLLAYTRPAPIRLGRLLTTPRLNVRPDGGGCLTLQALDLDATADPASPVDAAGPVGREFLRRLGDVLRGGDRVELEEVRVGQRVIPADGFTVAGYIDDGARLYVVTTHSGVTLAPLLGRMAAAEIVDGSVQDLLGPFRPQRPGLAGSG